MNNVLNYVKCRMLTSLRKKPKQVPFAWRQVEHGPLQSASVFVPANRSWGNDVVNGTYEPEFMSVFQEQVHNGGCLYDIGGHVGIFSVAWLKMGGDFVETFEPLPTNAHLIRDVLMRNQMQEKSRVHQLALGDFSAEGTLIEHTLDSSRGQIAELDNINVGNGVLTDKQRSYTVQVASLDNIFEEFTLKPPTIMKIDVEGAEYNVLRGAVKVIKRFQPMILTEIHDIHSALEVSALLMNMNYDLRMLGTKGAKKSLPLCQWTPQ